MPGDLKGVDHSDCLKDGHSLSEETAGMLSKPLSSEELLLVEIFEKGALHFSSYNSTTPYVFNDIKRFNLSSHNSLSKIL